MPIKRKWYNTGTQMHTKKQKRKENNNYPNIKLTRVHVHTKSHSNDITHSIGCINILQVALVKACDNL